MLKTQQNSRAKKKKLNLLPNAAMDSSSWKRWKGEMSIDVLWKMLLWKATRKKSVLKKKKTNVTTENGKRHIFTLVEQMSAKTSVLWIILKKGK